MSAPFAVPDSDPARASAQGADSALSAERRTAWDDFGAFYKSTLAPLRCYVSRILGDRFEAQDIAQDAYVRTYEAMHAHPVEKPRAFLFTTARRLALNFRHRRGSRTRTAESSVIEAKSGPAPDFVDALIARQDAEAFEVALNELPRGCREVLILQIKHGLSHAEISSRLEIAPSTVANQLARALRLLRAHIPDAISPVTEEKKSTSR